ncbi:tRNA-specific adenosine deaminase [Phlyctema vagabunda]|uniref:tRNA-specific adenosine deaminase n=1 Tax=Phlyctema vagabunda TaxID=108571 RepID=A0ABR4PTM0_9HELO
MEVSGDDIARTVLEQFDRLPTKRKPQVRNESLREWVPLSGIVAQGTDSLKCLALATGMKCLPQNKITQAKGLVLHDWHAEILAIRSFNRFLLEECHALARSGKQTSEYVRLRTAAEQSETHYQPFALNDGIQLHMYCSEAPCGDASMELTMASQEDSSPWILPSHKPETKSTPSSISGAVSPTSLTEASRLENLTTSTSTLHGRGYFSELGIVRRKPSRPDAPPTLSKSCTDKLSLKTSTSLLSSLTSLLILPSNCYLSSITLPASQYSQTACTRAFISRLAPLAAPDPSQSPRQQSSVTSLWEGGYRFQPVQVKTTIHEFAFCRRLPEYGAAMQFVSSNLSAAWTPSGIEETVIGGVLQGRKQFDVRGASKLCKRRMWKLALEIAMLATAASGAGAARRTQKQKQIQQTLQTPLYRDIKDSALLQARRRVKEDVRSLALPGWVRNEDGDEFEISGVQ